MTGWMATLPHCPKILAVPGSPLGAAAGKAPRLSRAAPLFDLIKGAWFLHLAHSPRRKLGNAPLPLASDFLYRPLSKFAGIFGF